MTTQGIIVLIAVGLTSWSGSSTSSDVIVYMSAMASFSSAPFLVRFSSCSSSSLLGWITRLVGALFPASALTLLALCFIVFMLVYVLAQITVVSNRLVIVVQELAIRQAASVSRAESAKDEPQGLERRRGVDL
jgi:hypothetical protein